MDEVRPAPGSVQTGGRLGPRGIPVAPLLGVAVVILANSLLGTVLGLRMTEARFSGAGIGAVVGAYFAGLIVGAVLVGRVVRRMGAAYAFAAAAAGACASTLALTLLAHPIPWSVLRAVTGFCVAALYIVAESWLNGVVSLRSRGLALGIYMVLNQLALGGGQALVPVFPIGSGTPLLVGAGLYAVALLPVLAGRNAPQPPRPAGPGLALGELFRSAPVSLSGALMSGIFFGTALGIGPVHAARLGLETKQVAAFVAAIVLGGLLLQIPAGRLSDRVDRRVILFAAAIGLCSVALLLLRQPVSVALLIAQAVALGAVGFTFYPLALAHAADRLPPERVAAGGASAMVVYGVGATLGPVVAAGMDGSTGTFGLPAVLAVGAALVAIHAARHIYARGEGVAEHSTYLPVSLPQAAPRRAISALDASSGQSRETDGEEEPG